MDVLHLKKFPFQASKPSFFPNLVNLLSFFSELTAHAFNYYDEMERSAFREARQNTSLIAAYTWLYASCPCCLSSATLLLFYCSGGHSQQGGRNLKNTQQRRGDWRILTDKLNHLACAQLPVFFVIVVHPV